MSKSIICRDPITFLAGSLFFSLLLSYALLLTLGQTWQSQYVPPELSRRSAAIQSGRRAPKSLVSALPVLPATAIIYPACGECTIDGPTLLLGLHFSRRAFVVIPNLTDEQKEKLRALDDHLTVVSSSDQVDRDFDIASVPKVVKVDSDGKLSYIQPSYLETNKLLELVNGK